MNVSLNVLGGSIKSKSLGISLVREEARRKEANDPILVSTVSALHFVLVFERYRVSLHKVVIYRERNVPVQVTYNI